MRLLKLKFIFSVLSFVKNRGVVPIMINAELVANAIWKLIEARRLPKYGEIAVATKIIIPKNANSCPLFFLWEFFTKFR